MGATLYTIREKGNDVKKVFNYLYEDALHEQGHDPYSGSIATTYLGREIQLSEEFYKKNKKNLSNLNKLETILEDQIGEDVLYSEKRTTNYVNLKTGVFRAYKSTYVVSKDTPSIQKGVRTINEFLIVEAGIDGPRNTYASPVSAKTLTEAKSIAKELTIKKGVGHVIKQRRSNGGSFRVGYTKLEQVNDVEYKTARVSKNKVYIEEKVFIFFVYAAC